MLRVQPLRANASEFRWTPVRSRAVKLVAADQQSDDQIAETLAIHTATLERWKQAPEFAAEVVRIQQQAHERLVNQGIREKVFRVAALNDLYLRAQRVLDERAADPELQDVPGGQTGLIVHQVRMVGTGPMAHIVDEYAVDTGLMREIRETMKQAAQELGQWSDGKSSLDINILIERMAVEQEWTAEEKRLALQESQQALRLLRAGT